MRKLLLICVFAFISCNAQNPTEFSKEALNDSFISLEGKELAFKDVINQYKGKKVLIDVWASWCRDCIVGMPKLIKLQEEYKDVVYLFLSLDKTQEEWKSGIKKYNIKGEHYFLTSGWKGSFGSFVNLDWIPRYMVINESGEISLFKAIHADDNKVLEALKK